VMADYFLKRKGEIDVPELYRSPETSAYGDINWSGMIGFIAGLIAAWSVQDGLVPALQGPISTGLLGGADLSWLFGIVVAGGVYLALDRRIVTAPTVVATGGAGE
jgi:cytosine/uracil/thiamine/allantoin permease